MGSMASWVGSGVGVLMLGLASLILKHKAHAHEKADPWLVRGVIALMFMGGSCLAVTILGSWITGLMRWAVDSSGGWGPPIAKLTAASLLAGSVIGIWKAKEQAAKAAAILPLVLALFTAGFLHNLDQATSPKARDAATQFAAWLGSIGGK